MKLFYTACFMCLVSISVCAQRVCRSTKFELAPVANSSARGGTTNTQNVHARDTIANEIITIPVVFHILFNNSAQNISDAQVLSQLAVLNNDYRRLNADAVNTPNVFKSAAADSRIMFCLAQVDPAGRPSSGIVRKFTNVSSFMGDDGMKFTSAGGDNAWDCKKYLNIWVCNMFGRTLGYATPPGGPEDKDGVVINFDVLGTTGSLKANFDKGRTATHEVGHWLGLNHIWGDQSCGDDGVDDTPRQLSYNFNCPSFPHVTNCSINNNGDMFMNYMDLTNDACMNMFTNGQKTRMRSLFALNGPRNSFLYSFACDSTLAAGAALPNDTLAIAKPKGSVNVYPNPVRDLVTIAAVNGYELEGKSCTIYNASGSIVMQTVFSGKKPVLDLGKLVPGIYILKIGTNADKKMVKVIKI